MEKIFDINPIGKPRMTQRDRWAKRPAVTRYFAFKDQIALQRGNFVLPDANLEIIFYIPMPDSWSKKKKKEHYLRPHQQKPDIDNLQKALFDALSKKDETIFDVHAKKYWAYTGSIKIIHSGVKLKISA